MASRLRIEFVNLSADAQRSGLPGNIISNFISAIDLVTSTTVTVAGSRPVVPANATYALIRALDAPIIVAWGDSPTAVATATGTANDGKRLQANDEMCIVVRPGMKISAIEVT